MKHNITWDKLSLLRCKRWKQYLSKLFKFRKSYQQVFSYFRWQIVVFPKKREKYSDSSSRLHYCKLINELNRLLTQEITNEGSFTYSLLSSITRHRWNPFRSLPLHNWGFDLKIQLCGRTVDEMKEDIFEGFIWVVDLQIQVQIQIDEWEDNSEEGVSVN